MSKDALVNQPSAAPSRKMFLGAVSAVVTAAVQNTLGVMAAKHVEALAWVTGDIMQSSLPIIVGFLVGYACRERGAPASAQNKE